MQTSLDHRQILKSELLRRVKKNRGYSLRAFARDLDISNAFLSQVMSGKRSLSEDKGRQIARKLSWPRQKTEDFVNLIRIEQCEDAALKALLYGELRNRCEFYDLEIEKFEVISNWIHFAIMELTRVKGFRSDAHWIAKKLGVTSVEIEDAVQRLITFGLLKKDPGLRIIKNASVPDTPSSAIQSFHKAHLEKSHAAIEKQKPQTRHFSGITTAIDPKNIPVANEMIKQFRRKLAAVLEDGNRTAVYHLAFQLYRLDSEEEN